MKRILYAGSLRAGDNGPDRAAVFEAAGYGILPADRFPHIMSGTRVERSIAARLNIGRSVNAFNRMLSEAARTESYDIVFVDKGVWVWPRTLADLKRHAKDGIAIHYTPDSQFLENTSRHFRQCLPNYDLCVTTKPFEVDHYRAGGAPEVRLIQQGFGKRLSPVPRCDIPDHLRSEVAFVGHCQPAYARVLEPLSRRVPLAIWGPNWPAYSEKNRWARACVRGSGVFGPDYARALSGAKIGIGLLSKRIPETTTTRTFEIPACRTMLLAERTDDHLALFDEGREAVFFASVEELCDKAEHYLRHDAQREEIAEAGYRRSIADGYRVDQQFADILDWLEMQGDARPAMRS
ncbi:CgeB family protein [Palleronia abyssalis]|uniref:Spore protein YkvP n=1 Tax=Palleronia abyssalis TaxID=1501240 RepID=A0A2R8BSC4_9RHOB|nr:glycosyltransferase [Palleronia abyssalis]SPJ23041.1 Spore protein YkvP [Palleronia abyssalis]